MDEMVEAICNELIIKKSRLNLTVQSIYFGGGTPSLLNEAAFQRIFNTLLENYSIDPKSEITIEANPDDLTIAQLRMFKSLPVNRFSIGIQSFFEEDLKWMNRAHNAVEADSSIKRAQDAGFENITIDLIYGFPLLTDKKWNYNLEQAIALNIPHLSAYAMTVESKTALAHAIKIGSQPNIDDTQSANQFLKMLEIVGKAGFEQYEISNFAKNEQYAQHNTNYWKGVPFLGIGPSAHGYDGVNRQFNIANNQQYIRQLLNHTLAETIETLSYADRYNEYIMTGLRTKWGVDLGFIEQQFGKNAVEKLLEDSKKNINKNNAFINNNVLLLTENGKLYADRVASDLFLVDAE